MTFLLRTLSVSHIRRNTAMFALTLAGIVIGVATFASLKTAQRALVGAMRLTIDRIAGSAQLQITGATGVPEELQEKIRDLQGIRAQAPVIEQVVTPEPASLGAILVLGVDLLGDREMRTYSLDGEDADLDDPLLFLAQPNSIALCRDFATRAGIKKNDSLVLRVGTQTKRVVVRALLQPKGFVEAFGGNVAVVDVYAAQELFGRGRRFDRIDVRLEEGTALETGATRLASAIGPGYAVQTPERRGKMMERLISNFAAAFDVSCGLALGIGAFLVYNSFVVSVVRRRREIGILRTLGSTPRQILAYFLAEAAVFGSLGGALGLLLGITMSGSALRLMRQTLERSFGVNQVAQAHLDWTVAAWSVLLGVLASIVGGIVPSFEASRVEPVQALALGSFTARQPRSPLTHVLAGLAFLALALICALLRPLPGGSLVVLIVGLGIGAVILLAPPLAHQILLRVAPVVASFSPVTGRLAADSLLSHPRRTASTVTAVALSLAFVIGTGGFVESMRSILRRWMSSVLTSDLFISGSIDIAHSDYKFSPGLKELILATPGVRAVESFRSQRIPFRGEVVTLHSIECEGFLRRAHPEILAGDEESLRRGLLYERKCAVSDNFRRLYGLGLGDTVELPCPSGTARMKIAAVITDFSSDRGSILVDRPLFVSLWNDDRVDTFHVSVLSAADVEPVREALRSRLSGVSPALVTTRKEFLDDINRTIDVFYALMNITVLLTLVVAFMGTAMSLMISVIERTREVGILKSLGAPGSTIRRCFVYEGLALTAIGFLLALPGGFLLTRFLATTVSEIYSGWHMSAQFPFALFLQVLVLLPSVTVLASWLPASRAAAVKATEAMMYE